MLRRRRERQTPPPSPAAPSRRMNPPRERPPRRPRRRSLARRGRGGTASEDRRGLPRPSNDEARRWLSALVFPFLRHLPRPWQRRPFPFRFCASSSSSSSVAAKREARAPRRLLSAAQPRRARVLLPRAEPGERNVRAPRLPSATKPRLLLGVSLLGAYHKEEDSGLSALGSAASASCDALVRGRQPSGDLKRLFPARFPRSRPPRRRRRRPRRRGWQPRSGRRSAHASVSVDLRAPRRPQDTNGALVEASETASRSVAPAPAKLAL
jgi:hypothetical protein